MASLSSAARSAWRSSPSCGSKITLRIVKDHTEEFLLPRDVVEDGVHWFLRCIRFGV